MKRLLFFACIVILAATGPVLLLAAAAFIYSLRYRAYELVFVAACIDAYFGTGELPLYLMITGAVIIIIELCRPYVRVRERMV